MGNWIIDFLNMIIAGLAAIINAIVVILPSSPFKALDNSPINQYLGMVNWFIPAYDILAELTAFCLAVLVYYGYSIVMRWIKAIE